MMTMPPARDIFIASIKHMTMVETMISETCAIIQHDIGVTEDACTWSSYRSKQANMEDPRHDVVFCLMITVPQGTLPSTRSTMWPQ